MSQAVEEELTGSPAGIRAPPDKSPNALQPVTSFAVRGCEPVYRRCDYF